MESILTLMENLCGFLIEFVMEVTCYHRDLYKFDYLKTLGVSFIHHTCAISWGESRTFRSANAEEITSLDFV